MRPSKIVIALVLLGFGLAASCSDSAESGSAFIVRGEVVGKPFEGQALRIRHEEIPTVMGAMTMDFRLKDPAEADSVQVGDKIRFRYVVKDIDSHIDQIEVLDPDTSLELAEGSDGQEH